MIKSLLIANRGEIACRIIATAQRMGIHTVAVHSEADATTRHVRLADESRCIGPASAAESYLWGDKIIATAAEVGAAAIHPGYGFLSENADFAQACGDAGLIFVGPSPNAIRGMGSKRIAKDLMQAAEVPVIPDYRGENQSDAAFIRAATDLGYPIMLKPALGGGGKGMRRVDQERDLTDALAAAKREAMAAFGDDEIIAEKYVTSPRHIEVQIFGDLHGNFVHLFERDCTLQRRHQKIIEEAPSTLVSIPVREALRVAALRAAAAVAYTGAGTVEFLVEESGAFYFMEMNTRLQVEHPVTEAITGLDLVEWQLRIAAGESLPREQSAIQVNGHAIEARIYAESPQAGFLPAPGRVTRLVIPERLGVRVDRGLDAGDEVSPHYDPMVAKVIVRGVGREDARQALLQAVLDTRIGGLETNLAFLAALLADGAFKSGALDVQFVDRSLGRLVATNAPPSIKSVAAAAVIVRQSSAESVVPADPWSGGRGWQSNLPARVFLHAKTPEGLETVVLTGDQPQSLSWGGQTVALEDVATDGHAVDLTVAGQRHRMLVVTGENAHFVISKTGVDCLVVGDPFAVNQNRSSDPSVVAPMPGKVTQVHVSAGQAVEAGTRLATLEAMKMEHVLRAAHDGVVAQVQVAVGDFVEEGAAVVIFETVA
ncbi:MAG: biotin carboxylase N-terminal domain-containing protein [Alphaproteobacteria bacterium]